MKYLFLIRAGLWRKPIRTVLTTLGVAVAFLLFGLMHGVIAGFNDALENMSETRLRVMSRANMLEPMPIAHRNRIERVDGVTRVATISIIGAYYQDPKNGFSSAALDVPAFLELIPEISVPQAQVDAMMRTRDGAIVGVNLAERFGWQLGDRIPFVSLFAENEAGGRDWTVEIAAIADATDPDEDAFANEMYLHWDFFDESRATGKGTAHQFIVGIDDADDAASIAVAIDALFANSSDETTTVNEKEYITSMVRQVGDVRSFVSYILVAVLFTLLFLTGTTITQSIRDRTAEFGILKSMGFSDDAVFALVISEALLLCVIGAAVGLAIAALLFPNVFAGMGFRGIDLPLSVVWLGLAIAAAMALAVAFWPAWRVRRLAIAEATSGR